MKKVTLLICLLLVGFVQAQNLDQKTKNIIKAKFIGAKEYFAENKYNEALEKITEIEELTGKPTLATALDLKIQILLALDKVDEAEKEIETMQNMDLSNKLISNISQYNKKITSKKEEIKVNNLKEQKLKEEKIREKKIKEEQELEEETKKRVSFFKTNTNGNNLFPSKKNDLFGYVDKDNNLVIEHQYLDAGPMVNGRALVKNIDKKIGMIDYNNNEIIKMEYTNLLPLNKNHLLWWHKDIGLKVSDINGELDKEVYTNYVSIIEGSHWVLTSKNQERAVFISPKLYIKNITGYSKFFSLQCLSLQKGKKRSMYFFYYDFATEFYTDINNITIEDDDKSDNKTTAFYKTFNSDGLIGYIYLIESYEKIKNTNQEGFSQQVKVVEPQFKAFNYVEGSSYFIVENQKNLKGVIDVRTQKEIIPISYSDVKSIKPFLYIVENKKELKGVINAKTNKIIIPLTYSDIQLKSDRRGTFLFCKEPNEENPRKGLKFTMNGEFVKKIKI